MESNSFDHKSTESINNQEILNSEITLGWADKYHYDVLENDSNANVFVVGENHVNNEHFRSQLELIDSLKPKYIICEGLPFGRELINIEKIKIWSIYEIDNELGIKIDCENIFNIAKANLEKKARQMFNDWSEQGLLEEGDTVEIIQSNILNGHVFPENSTELKKLPFYKWSSIIGLAFLEVIKTHQPSVKEKLGIIYDKFVCPMQEDRKNWEFYHTAKKAGSRIVGMDNQEAKDKIIQIIKTSVSQHNSTNFSVEQENQIAYESRKRKAAMLQAIEKYTKDGSSAVVIVGGLHIDKNNQDNYIDLDSVKINHISISQGVSDNPLQDILDNSMHIANLVD